MKIKTNQGVRFVPKVLLRSVPLPELGVDEPEDLILSTVSNLLPKFLEDGIACLCVH